MSSHLMACGDVARSTKAVDYLLIKACNQPRAFNNAPTLQALDSRS